MTTQRMAIEFLCPNGHRLSSPDASAGRPGKCPKCQAVFRVPQQSGARATPSDSGHSLPHLEEAESLSGRTTAASLNIQTPASSNPAGEVIVFLCPNGHRLNGPLSMQGKPGQCPHCGAKFIIPSYDDHDDDSLEIVDDDETVDDFDRLQGSSPVRDRSNSDSHVPLIGATGLSGAGRSTDRHPMATAFADLWQRRQIGRVVELFTKDGAKVTCERFRLASAGEYAGVFATRDEAGSLAMVAVAWDSVSRVILRGVRELPRDAFE